MPTSEKRSTRLRILYTPKALEAAVSGKVVEVELVDEGELITLCTRGYAVRSVLSMRMKVGCCAFFGGQEGSRILVARKLRRRKEIAAQLLGWEMSLACLLSVAT